MRMINKILRSSLFGCSFVLIMMLFVVPPTYGEGTYLPEQSFLCGALFTEELKEFDTDTSWFVSTALRCMVCPEYPSKNLDLA